MSTLIGTLSQIFSIFYFDASPKEILRESVTDNASTNNPIKMLDWPLLLPGQVRISPRWPEQHRGSSRTERSGGE